MFISCELVDRSQEKLRTIHEVRLTTTNQKILPELIRLLSQSFRYDRWSFDQVLLRHGAREMLKEIDAVMSSGLFSSPYMKGQLDSVAQILLIKNATNVTLYRPQAEL